MYVHRVLMTNVRVVQTALAGLRGKKNVEVFVLHPHGRVSHIQEKQMTTITDPNVHNISGWCPNHNRIHLALRQPLVILACQPTVCVWCVVFAR
jgi:hypothetical protein